MAREGQGYPCWRHDMMYDDIYIYIYSILGPVKTEVGLMKR